MGFGRLERRESPKPMGEINMTPLIDVMLVLLVIFIIAAPLMSRALQLELPKSEAATPTGQDAPFVALTLTAQGELQLDEQPVSADQLRERLQALGRRQPETELRLRADQAQPYGRVAELIGWAQAAGLQRIAFVAEGQPATAAQP